MAQQERLALSLTAKLFNLPKEGQRGGREVRTGGLGAGAGPRGRDSTPAGSRGAEQEGRWVCAHSAKDRRRQGRPGWGPSGRVCAGSSQPEPWLEKAVQGSEHGAAKKFTGLMFLPESVLTFFLSSRVKC